MSPNIDVKDLIGEIVMLQIDIEFVECVMCGWGLNLALSVYYCDNQFQKEKSKRGNKVILSLINWS